MYILKKHKIVVLLSSTANVVNIDFLVQGYTDQRVWVLSIYDVMTTTGQDLPTNDWCAA